MLACRLGEASLYLQQSPDAPAPSVRAHDDHAATPHWQSYVPLVFVCLYHVNLLGVRVAQVLTLLHTALIMTSQVATLHYTFHASGFWALSQA